MKKIRIYNYLIIEGALLIVSAPLMLAQTTKVMTIILMIGLCLILGILIEQRITLRIMKTVDKMKPINNTGLEQGLELFWIILTLIGIVTFISGLVVDIDHANITSATALIIWLPILSNQRVYLGEDFIHVQGAYIRIEDITSYEKKVNKRGMFKDNIEFMIHQGKATYIASFQRTSMKEGVNLLSSRLSHLE